MTEETSLSKRIKFGKMLKIAREEFDMTQTELGEELPQGKTQIGGYERGSVRPSLRNMLFLVNYLGLPAQEFTGIKLWDLENLHYVTFDPEMCSMEKYNDS